MTTPQVLGLPPITSELKSITPYLQRADEVKNQEPIIAYWCAYYAAQVGIGLKAKDPASRDVLFALLSVLEHMKSNIGPSDAIDIEVASSAYVENFALKIFSMADNEDRSGHTKRTTAKKFLAAANFLEVLKIFPKPDSSDTNGEKIRYAKWKAADIAKAYREGRKPTPGPPGFVTESEQQPVFPSPPEQLFNDPSEATLMSPSPTRGTPPHSPPHARRTSPLPPDIDAFDVRPSEPYDQPITLPGPIHIEVDLPHSQEVWETDGMSTGRENWSTFATPGTAVFNDVTVPNLEVPHQEDHARDRESPIDSDWPTGKNQQGGELKSSSGSESSSGNGPTEWVIKGSEGQHPTSPYLETSHLPNGSPPKEVHFTPSLQGSPTTNPPPSATEHYDPSSKFTPQTPPTFVYPPFAPVVPHHAPHTYIHPVPPPQRQSIPAQAPPELTPGVIAKVQKHCRFASSALDYEDAEQAKKELRAALAMLGG